MKIYKQFCYLLLLISFFTFSECKKHKPDTPVDQLPPATQTGASTFGCLVNGKVFTPSGDPFGGPIKSCAYQFVGGYSFQLKARRSEGSGTYSIGVFTDSLEIQEGTKLLLQNQYEKGKAYGKYSLFSFTGDKLFTTDSISSGELFIKKFDQANRIVSGTFWFDAVNDVGEKVQVREGRFDMKYTL